MIGGYNSTNKCGRLQFWIIQGTLPCVENGKRLILPVVKLYQSLLFMFYLCLIL